MEHPWEGGKKVYISGHCHMIKMATMAINRKNFNQRTIGPENAHLKPDPRVLSHHEMTLTLNTHTPLLNS